jgi:potassium efflux system protein
LPVGAQTGEPPERRVDLDEILSAREQVESNATLDDELRTRILQLYDSAISSLQTADAHKEDAISYERERSGVSRMVEALRAELQRPEREPRLDLPREATVEQAEAALARERAGLSANRNALRELERLAEERAQTRNDIAMRLGTLDQLLLRLADELRADVEFNVHPDLKEAARIDALARREAARSEIASLRARLALLEHRGALIPLQTDLAQRRVAFSEQMVALHEAAAYRLRREHANALLSQVREQCQGAAALDPVLGAVAAETEGLADMLWGPLGVIVRSEGTTRALITTRKHLTDLDRISDLTRRKFEAFGHRGSITRWWPEIPEDFPEPGDVAAAIRRLDGRIPEVEHQLITFEQQRSGALELAHRIRLDLNEAHGGDVDPDVMRVASELLAARRDILDSLIQQYGRYSDQLIEHRTVARHFLDRRQLVERFLYENILWSRSVPRPIVPRPVDLAGAMKWLGPRQHWQEAVESVAEQRLEVRGWNLITVLAVGLVVFFRRRIRQRLAHLAEHVGDPERDSYRLTLRALFVTVLLAAPLPLALQLAGSILARFEGSTYFFSASEAFSLLVLVACLLEFTRQLFAPNGLAEGHFGWPSRYSRPVHKGLLWPEFLSLPLLFVAILLVRAGLRLTSPDELQVYNNSLGRVAFIIGMLVLGVSVLTQIRPERKPGVPVIEGRPFWSRRLTEYAFPTALLYAYPIVLLATVVPALLAAFGYYVTGLLLAYQMLRTLLLAVAVLVFGGLVHRWRATIRLRSMREFDEQADDKAKLQEYEAAERQVRQLTRFAIIVAMAIGLYSIWSTALPMLEGIKRIQIWPRVMVMEAIDTGGSAGLEPSGTGASVPSEGSTGEGSVTPPSAVPGVPVPETLGSGDSTGGTARSAPLTLWNLLEALLAAVVTIVLAKNIPGLIEVILQRRTHLDSGARMAFSTLVRYTITIVGVSAVFGLLGVSWSNIQWLAAALTFGLGFGLQEIVANFVSGLILLIERPIRVGDVVTIGNLMGKVTRIQIRATTITLWDRSEMIVPNKEFITTKLVNWTLSDSKRRIEIPVRIAYGADLEQVERTLVDIACQHPAVLDEPEPHALLLGFGDDAINYELRFVVDFGQGLTTKHEVQMSIDRAFREHGIEFALPKREVRVISETGSSATPEPGSTSGSESSV